MALVLDGNGSMTVGNGDITGINTGALPSTFIGAGAVLQVVHQEFTPFTTTTSTSLVATGITATITPTSSSSFILVCIKVNGCENIGTNSFGKYELYKNSSSISYLNDIVGFTDATPYVSGDSFSVDYKDTHGVTSALTYAVYFASSSGSRVGFNNYGSGNNRTKSSIVLMEIAA